MWNKVKPWLIAPGLLLLLAALVRYTFTARWDAPAALMILGGLALIALAVALNWQSARRFYKKRSTVYLTFSIISTVVLLAILFLVNFIVWLHPQRFDLTEKKFFTLSEQTHKLLEGLHQPVSVLAFYKETDQDMQLDYLLRQYRAYSREFQYRFVDPDRDPTLTQQYGVTRYKTVIMESGDRRLRVDEASERGLTNTILKLVQNEAKSVYFLTGHGERDMESEVRDGFSQAGRLLRESNYEIGLLNLLEEPRVPADTAALVVAAARQMPTAAEMARVESYLNAGGSLLLLLDTEPAVGFESFLKGYGVAAGNDVVIDSSGAGRAIGAGPEVPLIQNYFPTEITQNFRLSTFFPRARSVTPHGELPEGLRVTSLMQTSRSSWGETEMGADGGVRYDEGRDLKGPVTLAVQIVRELPVEDGSGELASRLVVFGDADFASNVYLNAQGNSDLFLNSVNWLTRSEDAIAIRPKKPENRRLDVTAQSNKVIFYICVLLMPAVPLTAGIWVLVRRFK